jgi:hypothetical protein
MFWFPETRGAAFPSLNTCNERKLPSQTNSFADRCAALAAAKFAEAEKLPPGPERLKLEHEAWQIRNVPQLDNWLSAHDLQHSTAS